MSAGCNEAYVEMFCSDWFQRASCHVHSMEACLPVQWNSSSQDADSLNKIDAYNISSANIHVQFKMHTMNWLARVVHVYACTQAEAFVDHCAFVVTIVDEKEESMSAWGNGIAHEQMTQW